jgi:hypothetical protein
MTVLTVPASGELERAVQGLIRLGYARSRAEVARKAIFRAEEEMAIAVVLESEQAIREGKILRGDPRELLKKFQ